MNKNSIKITVYLCSVVVALFLCGCSLNSKTTSSFDPNSDAYLSASQVILDANNTKAVNNTYENLSVPTDIRKIDGLYFIVDCYHNQVIFNDNLTDPLTSWKVMTDDINMGHTIASDGQVYLIDDTENNRILVMEKELSSSSDVSFKPTQEFLNIGTRPHYIIYDDATDTFYAWSSMTGEMYLFRRAKDSFDIYLTEIRSIPELYGFYVRSFTIIDDEIYFVSGDGTIKLADLKSFKLKASYPVPTTMYGMVQLTKIQDYYYITISTDNYGSQDAATIIRCTSLDALISGDYEDIYSNFVGGGTPYSITSIDGDYYLCEHRLPAHAIWRFDVEDNELKNIETLY